jgi:hypothetical protein
MFATFILVLLYRYDRVTASLWIRYPEILLGEGATIGIFTFADYSVAKKCQQPPRCSPVFVGRRKVVRYGPLDLSWTVKIRLRNNLSF